MIPLKIGVQLASLRMPVKRAIGVAARMGVTGVEIDARGEVRPGELGQTGLRELKRLLDEHELRCAAVSFRTRRGYDEPRELDRRVAATKEAMTFAGALRAGVLVNRIGTVPAESEGPAWELLVQSLRDLSAHGQHVGVTLAATTSDSPADLARLIAALPEQAIGVNLDPCGLTMNGHSCLEAVQLLGKSVIHVHARDGVRDFTLGRGVEVPLGRGVADFPAIAAALEEHLYRGSWTVSRLDASDPEAELADAVKFLKNL